MNEQSSQASLNEPKTQPLQNQSDNATGLRFLALGDSYTAGALVAANERFPIQLIRLLRAMGVNIQDPHVIAQPGWTSADLIAGIAAANLSNTYDLITLLTGFANQYRGQALDDYRQQLRELIQRAVELAGGDENRILVMSIPDWGQTPYAKNFNRALIAEQIDAYNQINRAEANQAGAHYVDITSKARALSKQPGMLASDELHPSGLQYTAWMDAIFPEALAALG